MLSSGTGSSGGDSRASSCLGLAGQQGRMRAGLLVDHTGPDAPLGLAVSFLLELIQKSTELGWGRSAFWRVERRRKRLRME